jgi:hypothetical protein
MEKNKKTKQGPFLHIAFRRDEIRTVSHDYGISLSSVLCWSTNLGIYLYMESKLCFQSNIEGYRRMLERYFQFPNLTATFLSIC